MDRLLRSDTIYGYRYQWKNGRGIRIDRVVGWPYFRIRVYRWGSRF